mmetsp:Transcript_13594/g.40501  ORF Transcript_13594/g.40501 Transcript_13594/m.40501 type:complete len:273 (+) Transcript_13594:262-1080(+)
MTKMCLRRSGKFGSHTPSMDEKMGTPLACLRPRPCMSMMRSQDVSSLPVFSEMARRSAKSFSLSAAQNSTQRLPPTSRWMPGRSAAPMRMSWTGTPELLGPIMPSGQYLRMTASSGPGGRATTAAKSDLTRQAPWSRSIFSALATLPSRARRKRTRDASPLSQPARVSSPATRRRSSSTPARSAGSKGSSPADESAATGPPLSRWSWPPRPSTAPSMAETHSAAAFSLQRISSSWPEREDTTTVRFVGDDRYATRSSGRAYLAFRGLPGPSR